MDIVAVSGFGAAIGLGRFGEIWALARDARTETETMPTGTTTRAMDRNITVCNETICEISMSRVPCGIGNRDGGINTSTFYRSDYAIIGRRSRHRFENCLAIGYGCLDVWTWVLGSNGTENSP